MILIPENQEDLDLISTQYKQTLVDLVTSWTIPKIIVTLNSYFKKYNIKDVYLGISGGIDSAVAMELLFLTKVKVHPVCITYDKFKPFDRSFVNILNTYNKNRNLQEIRFIDGSMLLQSHLYLLQEVSPFIIEQISYALRYQILFSISSQTGGLVSGTTNKTELDYIGWFGSHSDMNVDIQFLHNFHKCQIIEIAKRLNVHPSIINRLPTGDILNGKTDEEYFDCTYDELSWFTSLNEKYRNSFINTKFSKVMELHKKNIHKYETKTRTSFNPVFID